MYFLSSGVTKTVGVKILGLSPSTALVVQLSGALTVHMFTQFGLPVSITQSLVGGILGIGLAKRIAIMNKAIIRSIIAEWITAPLIGFVIA